ncbi:MAG TPA: hypothetical protein VFW94_24430, partial [Candidatus Acidoferrales bacterium]|nr:hypothetical protein [Candidatus Acidoferrales bacterium]
VEVSSEHLNFLKYLADAEEEQLGIKDVTSIENIKMNIASDTAEKMIESVGPIAKGMAMRVERGNQAVGNRMKYLIPQWYTVARLMEYVGPDGISRETFDYDPNSLVPSHLPDEMPGGKFPSEASRYDQLTRARWFVRQLRLTSIPSTLLKITQVQEQLKYLQLKSRQAPISWLTVLRKLDVPNPEQEIERSFKEQVELEKMTLLSKIQLMQELKKLGIDPNALMGGEDQGQEGQGGRPRGRPQTDQRAPRLKQKGKKGGEPRTVMTTS